MKIRGDVPAIEVNVAPPSMTHAFALLLDLIAGPPAEGRLVQVDVKTNGDRATVIMTGAVDATHSNVNELITIAAYMIAREEGTLRCGSKRFFVELPLAEPSGFVRT